MLKVLSEWQHALVVFKILIDAGIVVGRGRQGPKARKVGRHASGRMHVVRAEQDNILVIYHSTTDGLYATQTRKGERRATDMSTSTVWTTRISWFEVERDVAGGVGCLRLINQFWANRESKSGRPDISRVPSVGAT